MVQMVNQLTVCLVVLYGILIVHSASITGKADPYRLIQYESTDTESGHKFSYDTVDGQSRDEELVIKNKGSEEEEIIITGSYSFKGTDGFIYRVKYTADKNGYHAVVEPPAFDEPIVSINTASQPSITTTLPQSPVSISI